MATFPLQCLICSETHFYSDVSHLLTHLSSKGHLSAQFKSSVRAVHDRVAAHRLDRYEQWFDENNIAELLSDRMEKKEEKKLRSTTAAKSKPYRKGNRQNPTNRRSNEDSERLATPSIFKQDVPIDPSIVVKQEQDGVEAYESIHQTGYHRKSIPADRGYRTSLTPAGVISQKVEDDDEAGFQWSPIISNTYPTFSGVSLGRFQIPVRAPKTIRLKSGTPQVIIAAEEPLSPGSKATASKLKGILWPGMSLFDAADAEGKRMRNQRKHYEVSSTLEYMSEQITPTEVIFFADTWEFKEDRVINGEVQSPPPSGCPTPKKRQKRAILSEKDANISIREKRDAQNSKPSMSLKHKSNNNLLMTRGLKPEDNLVYRADEFDDENENDSFFIPTSRYSHIQDSYDIQFSKSAPYPSHSGYSFLNGGSTDPAVPAHQPRYLRSSRIDAYTPSGSTPLPSTTSVQYKCVFNICDEHFDTREAMENHIEDTHGLTFDKISSDNTWQPSEEVFKAGASLRMMSRPLAQLHTNSFYTRSPSHTKGPSYEAIQSWAADTAASSSHIPPLGTFGHPRSLLNQCRPELTAINPKETTINVSPKKRDKDMSQTHATYASMSARQSTRRQAVFKVEQQDDVPVFANSCNNSSDGTIDQHIDDSPTHYKTRSVGLLSHTRGI